MDNPSPKTILLQGEPGSGKSMMGALTAIHKPVHVIDIDRKIRSAGWARGALASGALTVYELAEPFSAANIKARVSAVTKNAATPTAPEGWQTFADYMQRIHETPDGKAAGTWMIDSLTFLNEHFKTHIQFLAGKSKFVWDNWNALKAGWIDTVSFLRDSAKEHGKDLILTVHERDREQAGERTTGVKYEADKDGNRQRVLIGTQDIKVWASIDGAFGQLIGGSMDEYYWLHVVMQNGNPAWRCRVWPDGLRNLRTSFVVKQAEFDPDFKAIWK